MNIMPQQRVFYNTTLGELAGIPGTPFSYIASKRLRDLFQKHAPLDRDLAGKPLAVKISDVKSGLSTADDIRFTRRWWEVLTSQIGRNHQWISFAKKGLKPYFNDIDLVINWKNDGQEIRNSTRATIRNNKYYFRPGVIWASIVASERLEASLVPTECIFSPSGGGGVIFSSDENIYLPLIGVLNSRLHAFLFNLLNQLSHSREIGNVAKLPILLEALASQELTRLSKTAHDLLMEWATGDETATVFSETWLLQVWDEVQSKWDENGLKPVTGHPLARDFVWSNWENARQIRRWLFQDAKFHPFRLRRLAELCVERERLLRQRLDELQAQIDEEVYRLYEISPEDRALIEAELCQSTLEIEVSGDEEGEESRAEEEEVEPVTQGLKPVEEHLRRLVHYLAHEILKADQDGIVPLWDTYLPDGQLEVGLAERVKESLSDTFGPENLDTCLCDLQEAFSMSLEDWLETEFFPYHVGLYRLRPIVWQISSQRRGPAVFSCFIYWHKLDNDTLRKIQQVYLVTLINAAIQEADRLGGQLVDQRNAGEPLRQLREAEQYSQQAEARLNKLKTLNERITAILQPHSLHVNSRSEWVKEKVNEIVRRGYHPERDYGVRVNIEPFKQAGILPQAADRVKG